MTAAVPFLVTLALCLWGIRREGGVWGDEAITYEAAQRGLPDLVGLVGQTDAVHGLYYFFMHGVFAVFGDSVLALRLPSVLAMAAAAAGIALIGRRLAGPRAGLLAGLVLPLPTVVQWYAQDGRSYALVTALVTWSTWLLLRAVTERRTRLWAGYAAVTLLACLVHEFAVLAVLAHGVTLLLSRVPRAVARAWAAAGCGVLLGLTPLALLSMRQAEQISWLGPPGWENLYDFPRLALLGLLCVAVTVLLGEPAGHDEQDGPSWPARGPVPLWALALPLLLVPTAVLLLVSFTVKPLYVDRYVLFYTLGFALPAGAALDLLWRLAGQGPRALLRRPVAAVLALALIVVLLPGWAWQRTADSREDNVTATAEALRSVLRESAEPGDGLVFIPSRLRSITRVHPDAFEPLDDLALARDPVSSRTLYGVEHPVDRIAAELTAAQRVVVLTDEPARGQARDRLPRENVKREVLDTHFSECDSRQVTGTRITVYARGGC